MPAFRIIPCLDVDAGRVVKGVRFVNLREMGDPVELAMRYRDEGADELVFLDVSATVQGRATLREVVARVAEVLDVPFTVGGGVRREDDADALLRSGADKVAVNTAAVEDPALIERLARRFGSQCVVLAIDARRRDRGQGSGVRGPEESAGARLGGEPRTPSPETRASWEVVTHAGRRPTGRDVVSWAREGARLGCGELLVTSMDRDGTGRGFDEELIATVREAADVPLIASGGGETAAHFAAAARAGADAGLAATIFHEARVRIADLKRSLAAGGVEVRMEGNG